MVTPNPVVHPISATELDRLRLVAQLIPLDQRDPSRSWIDQAREALDKHETRP